MKTTRPARLLPLAALLCAIAFSAHSGLGQTQLIVNGGNQTLNIPSGNSSTNSQAYVGWSTNNNTLNVAGNLTASNTFIGGSRSGVPGFGDGSNNAMNISSGGRASLGPLWIGTNSSSSNNTVTVNGTGATLNSNDSIITGAYGSNNNLVISNGGNVSATSLNIGVNSASSNNTVLITGADSIFRATATGIGVTIGYGGSNNTLTVANGGTFTGNGSAYIVISNSPGSSGTLNFGRFGESDTAGTVDASLIVVSQGNSTINFNQVDDMTLSSAFVSGGGNSSINQLGNGNTTLTGPISSFIGTTTISAGTLSIGNGSASSNITTNILTNITNNSALIFNRSQNSTYTGSISGSGNVTKLGAGVLTMTKNSTYSGFTSIQEGTLSVRAPIALGTGNVSLSAGTLLVASGQEMSGSLQIGGHFDWTGGTIAYYDTGASPGPNDMQIVVGGNFTASAGNKTFDFSQVDALSSGNYTLVSAGNVTVNLADLIATHGPSTTLTGTFSTSGTTIVYTVTGATSGGNVIQNVGGPNTPLVADYDVTTSTITVGSTNTIKSLNFSNSSALTINATGQLIVTSGNLTVQSGGTSVVSGGTLITSGSLAKQGSGELDLQSNTNVNGVATVVEGLLSVNAQLNANSVVVDPNATLGGAGTIIASNVIVNGNLSPGNSPGTLNVAGNLVLTGANSTIIEIASPTNFDRIVVTGTATLGGRLNAVGYEGYTIAPGSRFDFLQAGSIVGAYDSITAPTGLRARFLNSGTIGTLLFGPSSYVMMAINQNQRNVAKALDSFILATSGDRQAVSIGLDSLTTEQYPAAFDQIMPGFYESLANIAIEQTYNQTQLLSQRLGTVRLGATGFQAIGLSQPIKYDKDGKSAADAKTASPIVEAPADTNWNSWVIANGEFSLSRGLSGVPNYNNNAGGFLVGADYRLSENFAAGLFAGYEYSYAKYNGGSSTRGNSALFGLYGTYTHEDGYYADAIVSGGYTGLQTRRSIEFSTIDRTASADPNSGQFSAALNLGKDFEIGKFTLGPIIGAQYTYVGIGGFTESGAESLDLALGQQNANSFRTNLGARLAYNWEVGSNITLIPEVRGFWMHEFLNNPRNISSALEGGSGPSFDYETSAPYRNSVFGGVGISAKFADRWSASVFYNVNFGAEGYTNNIISTSLGISF